jgi:hypothetical protein
MGIDHRRFDVIMPHKFLNRSDIITTLKQVSGEAMPEGVTGGSLYQSCIPHGISLGFLNQECINIVTSL